jgi:hypothetical protein
VKSEDQIAAAARLAYDDSIVRLNRFVEQIPMGWQKLYLELRLKLYAISCAERSGAVIDRVWAEDGCLQFQSETTDAVVQGILRKTRVRASHTCMRCGKPGKMRELDEWQQATLCGTCAAPRLLELELARVAGLERCGAVHLRHELQSSSRAALIRAAAEAEALACGLPRDFIVTSLDDGSLRNWLHELKERLRQDEVA